MEQTNDIQKQAEREKIVKAARSYIFKHGFHSLDLKKFASKLGISSTTMYSHFRSKPLLVMAAFSDKVNEQDRDLQAVHARKELPFAESVQMLLEVLHRHAQEYTRAFVHDLTNNAAIYNWAHQQRTRIIKSSVDKSFELGRREGVIRDDIPAELFSEVYLLLTDGALVERTLKRTKAANAYEIIKTLFSLMLNGALRRCKDCTVGKMGNKCPAGNTTPCAIPAGNAKL